MVTYKRTGETVEVLKVHSEDPDGVYMTVRMADGREKQTTPLHVTKLAPKKVAQPEIVTKTAAVHEAVTQTPKQIKKRRRKEEQDRQNKMEGRLNKKMKKDGREERIKTKKKKKKKKDKKDKKR